MSAEYRLTKEIIDRSVNKSWNIAKQEWFLFEVYESEEPDTCLCGHFPIIEICILQNRSNGNFATVGNVCVKKFIGLPSDKIFTGVKRVRKDVQKSLNDSALRYAFEKGWLNDWEFSFYQDIMRKRVLTTRQREKKDEINVKIVSSMKR